jgi:hypothetical protein
VEHFQTLGGYVSARKLYQDFHDEKPGKVLRTGVRFGRRWITVPGSVNILIPEDMMIVGRLNAIEYDCRREGRTLKARHVFAPGARPMLGAGTQNGQLFLLGTRYRMTDRGVVDFNSKGQAIDYHENTDETHLLHDF